MQRRSEAQARLEEQAAQAGTRGAGSAEEIRLKVEEEARRRAEVEASLKEEEARLHAEH